jgi:hypothetical protein
LYRGVEHFRYFGRFWQDSSSIALGRGLSWIIVVFGDAGNEWNAPIQSQTKEYCELAGQFVLNNIEHVFGIYGIQKQKSIMELF